MWLCDLEKAISELRSLCPDYVFEKIVPAGSGIAFYTTHFTRILWSSNGIIERDNSGNIEILKWGDKNGN